jgi:hypothetical protein
MGRASYGGAVPRHISRSTALRTFASSLHCAAMNIERRNEAGACL